MRSWDPKEIRKHMSCGGRGRSGFTYHYAANYLKCGHDVKKALGWMHVQWS